MILYPPNWPRCPGCGEPALDGHITCGRLECLEGAIRRARQRSGAFNVPTEDDVARVLKKIAG